ncbi:MAG: hypothetical protein DYG99_01040 [Bacteroidetes bacterium CHB5]|nr:hypothetical protein [Bacteroidetes bacterium CHB5]
MEFFSQTAHRPLNLWLQFLSKCNTIVIMLAPAEIYKGIAFVRIGLLPADQQEKIKSSIKQDRVIKILIGNTLAEDCVQYHDYKRWFAEAFPAPVITPSAIAPSGAKQPMELFP